MIGQSWNAQRKGTVYKWHDDHRFFKNTPEWKKYHITTELENTEQLFIQFKKHVAYNLCLKTE